MQKFTKDIALQKIKEKINTLNNIEFIEFQNNIWKGTKNTNLILKCTIHNELGIINFKTFIKNGWSGCKFCIKEKRLVNSNRYRLTKELAEKKLLEIFGKNFYIKYTIPNDFGPSNKTIIGNCPIHGQFTTNYKILTRKGCKGGCKQCYYEKELITEDIAIKKINDSIIEKKNREFKYDISFLGFVDNKWKGINTKLILKCNKHNIIWKSTSYNGFVNSGNIGCSLCKKEKRVIDSTLSPEEAFSTVKEYNRNNLIFDKILQTYTSFREKVIITCPIHGDFEINYNTLLINPTSGKCPICNGYSGEILCKLELNKYNINILTQKRLYINNQLVIVDFYIPELNTVIEYDGEQHIHWIKYFQPTYQDFINQVNRDRCLEQYCKENNICLLRIPYKDNNRIPEIIKIFFEEGKDITTKVEPKLLPVLYHG